MEHAVLAFLLLFTGSLNAHILKDSLIILLIGNWIWASSSGGIGGGKFCLKTVDDDTPISVN